MKPGGEMDARVCERLGITPEEWDIRYSDRSSSRVGRFPAPEYRRIAEHIAAETGGEAVPVYPAVSTDPALRHLLEDALLKRALWPIVFPESLRGDTITEYGCVFIPWRVAPLPFWDFTVTVNLVTFETWVLDGVYGTARTPQAAICAAVLELPEEACV